MSKEEESAIYDWAFVTGQKIIEKLEGLYGEDGAKKRMESRLLTLRSELIPERFRRAIIEFLIEVGSEVGIPKAVKVERKWSIDEFYRYSTAILAGLFDALNARKREKVKEVKKAEEKEGGGKIACQTEP